MLSQHYDFATDCLGLLLAGVELYVAIGREMGSSRSCGSPAMSRRWFGTSHSAAELKKLYEDAGSAS
jgi:hypothetical protein